MAISPEILRFGAVGAVGFIVDGGILSILINNGVDVFLARFFSFPVAVSATWWLNRIWTFSEADKSFPVRQFKRYLALQLAGALANFTVYAAILAAIETTLQNALLALAAGAGFGMFVNFIGSKLLIYTTAPGTGSYLEEHD